jgi:hypothetical protein
MTRKKMFGLIDSDFSDQESSLTFGSDAWASAAASLQGSQDRASQNGWGVRAEANEPSVPLDATGTTGANVFLVHTGTLAAALAQPPVAAQFSGYNAAQGDLLDFTAMRSVAFIPSEPTSAQLRVIADPGGQFSTFQFNFGTTQSPNWTTLAELDSVHAGDTVKVAIDATHTFDLLV